MNSLTAFMMMNPWLTFFTGAILGGIGLFALAYAGMCCIRRETRLEVNTRDTDEHATQHYSGIHPVRVKNNSDYEVYFSNGELLRPGETREYDDKGELK